MKIQQYSISNMVSRDVDIIKRVYVDVLLDMDELIAPQRLRVRPPFCASPSTKWPPLAPILKGGIPCKPFAPLHMLL